MSAVSPSLFVVPETVDFAVTDPLCIRDMRSDLQRDCNRVSMAHIVKSTVTNELHTLEEDERITTTQAMMIAADITMDAPSLAVSLCAMSTYDSGCTLPK
jgi:hypothetical protein